MLTLSALPSAYRLSPNGNLRFADASTPETVAAELGLEDQTMLESLTLVGGRRAYARQFSDLEPLNPLASQWAGREVNGTIVVMPRP